MSNSNDPLVETLLIQDHKTSLQKLYVDLCNLIVESRVPGINGRGYGDGCHCPPLLGPNTHVCDLSKPHCLKHKILIHHLLQAVKQNVFEIKVLMLPDCCPEYKIKENIQNKNYVLLENWSMECISCNDHTGLEIPQLLRAVRSFLHFSQMSAWLSSTKGKSPSNIYYWIKSNAEASETGFEQEPIIHTFPTCKISDEFCGIIKVEYSHRTSYIPVIPCSKHPTLCKYSLRTVVDNSNACENMCLNSQISNPLKQTNDIPDMIKNTFNTIEPISVVLPVHTHQKNLDSSISKSRKILKYSSSGLSLVNTLDTVSSLSFIENTSNSPESDDAITFTQRNAYFENMQLAIHLHKTKFKLKLENNTMQFESKHSTPYKIPCVQNCSEEQVDFMKTSYKNLQFSAIKENHTKQDLSELDQAKDVFTKEKPVLQYSTSLQSLIPPQKQSSKIIPKKRKIGNLELNMTEVNLAKKKFCCTHETENILPIDELKDVSQNQCTSIKVNHKRNKQKKSRKAKKELIKYSKEFYRLKKVSETSKMDFDHTTDFIKCGLIKKIKSKSLLKSRKHQSIKQNRINKAELLHNTDLHLSKGFLSSENKCSEINVNVVLSKHENLAQSSLSSICANSKSFIKKKFYSLNQRRSMKGKLRNDEFSGKNTSRIVYFSNLFKSKLPHKYGKIANNCSDPNSKYTHLGIIPNKLILNHQNAGIQNMYPSQTLAKSIGLLDNEVGIFKYQDYLPDTLNLHVSKHRIKHTSISKRFSWKRHYQIDKFNKQAQYAICQDLYLNVENRQNLLRINTLQHFKNNFYVSNELCQAQENEISKESRNGYLKKHIQNGGLCISSQKKSIGSADKSKISPLVSTFEKSALGHNIIQNNKLENSYGIEGSDQHANENCQSLSCSPSKLWNSTYRSLLHKNQETKKGVIGNLKHSSNLQSAKRLLWNFEESILKGCFPIVNNVEGFSVEIGASGSFFPNHITLPAGVSFYELENSNQGSPTYMAHVINIEYFLPKKGAVQVTLFNPLKTVVKMFIVNYDLSNMPPDCHTFIRQKIYYLPIGCTEKHSLPQKWLRFIIHLRFASSSVGKIYLYNDIKIVVLNKCNDDAASELSQEPRELCSFVSMPKNPTFSYF